MEPDYTVLIEQIRDEFLMACAEMDYRLEQLQLLIGDNEC